MLGDLRVCTLTCCCFAAVDMYDDHVFPATAAQTLLCKASRKRKEVATGFTFLPFLHASMCYFVLVISLSQSWIRSFLR